MLGFSLVMFSLEQYLSFLQRLIFLSRAAVACSGSFHRKQLRNYKPWWPSRTWCLPVATSWFPACSGAGAAPCARVPFAARQRAAQARRGDASLARASLLLGVGHRACGAADATPGLGEHGAVQGLALRLPPGAPLRRRPRAPPARMNRLLAAWKSGQILFGGVWHRPLSWQSSRQLPGKLANGSGPTWAGSTEPSRVLVEGKHGSLFPHRRGILMAAEMRSFVLVTALPAPEPAADPG